MRGILRKKCLFVLATLLTLTWSPGLAPSARARLLRNKAETETVVGKSSSFRLFKGKATDATPQGGSRFFQKKNNSQKFVSGGAAAAKKSPPAFQVLASDIDVESSSEAEKTSIMKKGIAVASIGAVAGTIVVKKNKNDSSTSNEEYFNELMDNTTPDIEDDVRPIILERQKTEDEIEKEETKLLVEAMMNQAEELEKKKIEAEAIVETITEQITETADESKEEATLEVKDEIVEDVAEALVKDVTTDEETVDVIEKSDVEMATVVEEKVTELEAPTEDTTTIAEVDTIEEVEEKTVSAIEEEIVVESELEEETIVEDTVTIEEAEESTETVAEEVIIDEDVTGDVEIAAVEEEKVPEPELPAVEEVITIAEAEEETVEESPEASFEEVTIEDEPKEVEAPKKKFLSSIKNMVSTRDTPKVEEKEEETADEEVVKESVKAVLKNQVKKVKETVKAVVKKEDDTPIDQGELAFKILLDLGMIELTPDPDDPNYDSSLDDELAPENVWVDGSNPNGEWQ